MKSKITKIQKAFMKGIAVFAAGMMLASPIVYATTSLDDSYLESSWWQQLLYGKIGSTAKEIEEYFNSGKTTLYITNETQLRAFAEYVNNGNDCEGKEIILLNDIEVDKENEWVPIGNELNPFSGIFNGNEHSISGIRIYRNESDSAYDVSNIGLFGWIMSGTIKNVNVSEIYINVELRETDSTDENNIDNRVNRIGGITGFIHEGKIINCEVSGMITTGDEIGGIAGEASQTVIDYCLNNAYITGNENVGGITGRAINESTIINSSNSGEIKGNNIGGIVGKAADESIIKNCSNNSKIIGDYSTGGIVGILKYSKVENCFNDGHISNSGAIGGIVGTADGEAIENGKQNIIINCTNKGEIFNRRNGEVGGIAGRAHYPTAIENSINLGKVDTGSSYEVAGGGICGFTAHATIERCINEGEITYSNINNKGAIVGLINEIPEDFYKEKTSIINNCINIRTDVDIVVNMINLIGSINYKEGTTKSIEEIEGSEKSYNIAGKLTKDDLSNIEIDNFDKIYKLDSKTGKIVFKEEIGFKELNKDGSIDLGATKVTIDITKNGKAISINEYFKAEDVIKVKVSFDKYLAKIFGPLTPITEAPILKINNEIEMEAGAINASESSYITTIDYTYKIKEGDNFNVESLVLSNIKDVYGVDKNDWDAEHSTYTEPDVINIKSESISCSGIIVDTKAPSISTEVYVENALETERYTAGKEILFRVTTSEGIEGTYELPEIQVSFSESGIGKYNYTKEDERVGYAKCIDAKINLDGTTTWVYSYQIQEFDEGELEFTFKKGIIEDFTGNVANVYENAETKTSAIYADTTVPTVVITPNVQNSLTNKDTVTYSFIWSEALTEFREEDITVNNGAKSKIVIKDITEIRDFDINKDDDINTVDLADLKIYIADEKSKYDENFDLNLDGILDSKDINMMKEFLAGNLSKAYSVMEITTNIEDGNVGDLQVIIEENACQDLVGHGNVRTESVIRVDKKAPMLQTLEAYAESGIKLNSEIDVVKEHYKTGEKITVVATFDENITAEKVPELVLQFSESKNSIVLNGTIESNKIIYTYIVAEGDEGTVSVRAFNGTVIDAAGNSTNVTRKALDGNTIIVDTKEPSLKELNVTTEPGTYNAGKTITIEAIYDENVYALKDNEIKNITLDTAPTLKVKFGNGEEREATFNGYAGEDKSKLIYQATIIDTDNGKLSIVSYENKENVKVCDIAGNEVHLNNKQTGNEITADNIRPEVIAIDARVQYPSIQGTDIYYKEGNTVKITLTFSEEVSSNKLWPEILVGFSEEKDKEPAEYTEYAYESDWNVNSKTIEYSYTVRNGENGYLWVKVPEGQFRDIAGNTNVAKDGEEKLNVFADTIIPTVTLYRDTEETQNNQTITIKATFNENVYDLNGDRRITLTTANAPKLIYSFGDGANREIGATSISGATITYTIQKDPVEDNGELNYELAKGNLCDRAGNELYTTTLDTTAPVLQSVVITSNAPEYGHNCKEGKEIYVIATFDEPVKAENMKLKAKVGVVELPEVLDGVIVEENETKVKFTYTVNAGDMGVFKILDICGETDSKITEENADKTYGWVRDEHGNQNNIYSLQDEKVTVTGKAEADTKDPYITSIKAKVDEETIATYTKEEGKDAVITVGRTNENIVEYIVTYNEKVNVLDKSKISIENGIIKSIEYTDLLKLNEFKITVQTTVEGVQSLIINEATVEDKAGNTDEFVRLNAVTVDFTKPTVRFISEYNGGVYVLPTNIGKVEIRPNVEISEDIARIAYKWDNGEYVEIQNYSSSSDIAIPTKAFTEAGKYKLFIKVIDLAGNDYETSKTYEIKNSNIDIELSTYEYTNKDVTATVSFEEGLTDNRKVTFKAENSNEVVELNAAGVDANGGVQYTIETNGTIYVEATDKVGNKVFTEDIVTNIDKEKPVIDIELNGANLVIGTGKDKAVIKTNVTATDNNWVEEAKYAFLNEDMGIYNLTDAQKAKINNELDLAEAKVENAVSTKDKTPYYLYVLAKDKAGNETIVMSNPFTVVDTNERKVTTTVEGENGPEEKVDIIPAEKLVSELIIFEQMEEDNKDKAYVSVNHDYSIIEELEISLADESYGYVNYEYDSVELYGNTKIIVKAWDACGNEVTHEYEVKDIVGPEFTISGNPENWTNDNVELEVYSNAKLETLTLNGKNILGDNKYRVNTTITEYGNYTFEATDIYNNTSEQTIEVRIDKSAPEITDVKIEDGKIVITANDIDKTLNKELSGLAEYAITDTTEVPVEWSKSNVINVTKDANFFVWAKDNAGNIAMKEEIVVRDITAPELTITTDIELDKWTNTDVKVEVKSNEELSSLILKYKEMVEQEGQMTEVEKEENILETKTYTITSNGTYEVIGTDKSGNIAKETIKVSKIDKDIPVIDMENTKAVGKDITVTATDEGSGIAEYAISTTTEIPVEWTESNVIKVTEDGIFYVWAKDNAGNISRAEDTVIIDTTAPTITFNYLSQTITVGMPLEASIITNEDAKISYSWDKETWVDSEELLTSLKVSEKSTTIGKYTLYAKAEDAFGNESKVQTLEFEVTTIEEIKQPDIIFEDIPTIQVNGARYVKISSQMTLELLTDLMNKEALCGKTPEYINLTEDGKLRTGSEITINGETKYIVVVKGDVNSDGEIDFIKDIIRANNYRLGIINLTIPQILAADVNNNGKIEFIQDIIAINNYRLGLIKSL